jgi:hypothetical protein
MKHDEVIFSTVILQSFDTIWSPKCLLHENMALNLATCNMSEIFGTDFSGCYLYKTDSTRLFPGFTLNKQWKKPRFLV